MRALAFQPGFDGRRRRWQKQEAVHLTNIQQRHQGFRQGRRRLFLAGCQTDQLPGGKNATRQSVYQIFVMDLASSEIPFVSARSRPHHLSFFSPDGKKIIFAAAISIPMQAKHYGGT